MQSPSEWKSRPARYGGAAICIAASLLIRVLLNPVLGAGYPYVVTVLAVLVSARYFGVGPSTLGALAGGVAVTYLAGGHSLLTLVFALYLLVCAAAIALMETQRHDQRRAAESARLADRRLAELAQEQGLSASLRAIVESSEDAIISKDLDGTIKSWNKAAEHIFLFTSEEMIGQTMAPLLPAERTEEEVDIIERIRRGGRVKHIETVRLRKDGKRIPVSLTISPIHDESGRVIGASHIARDISEQKQLEEQVRQAQKLESLGVLAGGLAHDFNNLLTGVMGNASLALDEGSDPQSIREYIGEILHASERASLLVRQMLAYAGKGPHVVEALDLSQQITEIVALLHTSVSRNVELKLELDPDGLLVEADRSQLQQLVMNLAINGAEAIGEQSGKVTIATGRRESDQEKQVVLTVSDTGSGMDEATKAQMFDPFFTTKFTGRGLGLAAVLGIIRTHRGTISVDTAPGRGTTVTVVLPASSAVRPAPVPEEQMQLRGYGNILVIDDEELVRSLAKFTLERCGYTVELAVNGQEGLDLFAARPFEFAAVLLDLTMPVMGGEEALSGIQRVRPEMPVVLSSGFSEEEARRRFGGRSLAGFLQKPYTATALARKIKQALRDSGVQKAS